MRITASVQNVEYTLAFEKPLFNLPKMQADILQACFENCASTCPIELSDLQAVGGTSYADVAVRIGFPALRGHIEVRVDRFVGSFRGVVSAEHLQQIKDTISLCEEAVGSVAAGLRHSSTSISVSSWLSCEGGRLAIRDFFNGHQQFRLSVRDLGGETGQFLLRGEIANETETWKLGFVLEPSASPEHDLYFTCVAHYGRGSRYDHMHTQATHIERVRDGILNQLGFTYHEHDE